MLQDSDLLKMLSYKRPAWSKTEDAFIRKYIDTAHPEIFEDKYGNRILYRENSKVIIACHTDTVHRDEGMQNVRLHKRIAQLPKRSTSNCLGADDTAGVYAALRMIEAGVQATFIFHRAEEIGGCGSSWLAKNYPEWLQKFDICLSLDRRGTTDIITSQAGGKCASNTFASSLAAALDMGHKATAGIFTDSANYTHLIRECSNISVGYQLEHTSNETLDLDYLELLIQRLIVIDWTALTVERAVTDDGWDDREDYSWYFGRGYTQYKRYDYSRDNDSPEIYEDNCEWCDQVEELSFSEGLYLCKHCYNYFLYEDAFGDDEDDTEGDDSPSKTIGAVN
jgi:hypothetical protein